MQNSWKFSQICFQICIFIHINCIIPLARIAGDVITIINSVGVMFTPLTITIRITYPLIIIIINNWLLLSIGHYFRKLPHQWTRIMDKIKYSSFSIQCLKCLSKHFIISWILVFTVSFFINILFFENCISHNYNIFRENNLYISSLKHCWITKMIRLR